MLDFNSLIDNPVTERAWREALDFALKPDPLLVKIAPVEDRPSKVDQFVDATPPVEAEDQFVLTTGGVIAL